MQMNVTKLDNGTRLSVLEDRIDAAVALEFKETVRGLAADGDTPIVLDLSQVQFLDSSGLGAVVAVMKLLAPAQRLELSGLTPPVAKVLRLTRMDTIFVIHGPEGNGLRAAG